MQLISRSFSSCKTETPYPLDDSPFPLPAALGKPVLSVSVNLATSGTYTSGIREFLSFYNWPISLSMMSSSFTHVVAYVTTSRRLLQEPERELMGAWTGAWSQGWGEGDRSGRFGEGRGAGFGEGWEGDEASSLGLQRWPWTGQWQCDLCAPSEDGGGSDPGPDLGTKEIEKEPLLCSWPRALRRPAGMKASSQSGFFTPLVVSSYRVQTSPWSSGHPR